MPVSTGLRRLFGIATQRNIQQLKRQATMALSEVVEEPSTAPLIPRQVTILRYDQSSAPVPSQGDPGSWDLVAGLTNLTAFVRTHGRWIREGEERASEILESERIITIADIPATGAGAAAVPASTVVPAGDMVTYDDPFRGQSTWTVIEVRPRQPAQLCTCLVEFSRRD